MDSGGGTSTTVGTFVPALYIYIAKTGRFRRLAGSFVRMLRFTDHNEDTGFDVGTNGGFYFRLESDLPDGIYLVCPDNSLSFDSLEAMTVAGALDTLAAYGDSPGVPKWTELAEALDDVSSTLSTAISSVDTTTTCGLTIPGASIPAWQSPGSSISVLFRWIKQLVQTAETYNSAAARQMTDYRASSNRFDLPISMAATIDGKTVSFSFDLYLLI